VVGYLSRGAGKEALAGSLAERGYVEGRNLRIELRQTSADPEELEARSRELIRAQPDVLVAWGAKNINALARQTRTIPIVCGGTADPVGMGYAETLRRPGGNITGLSLGLPEMAELVVGLMASLRPGLRRIATYVIGGARDVDGWTPVLRPIEGAARRAGLSWEIVPFASMEDFERALGILDPASSLAYLAGTPSSLEARQIAAILIRRRLMSATSSPQAAREGLLMHYSVGHTDERRRVAAIVDAVLRGADPAGIPFQLPDRTIFVLNRRTARAIGLDLSPALLTRATEIVE
jgi:putative tryptophan/tyrosine transport system substrate-binding protein